MDSDITTYKQAVLKQALDNARENSIFDDDNSNPAMRWFQQSWNDQQNKLNNLDKLYEAEKANRVSDETFNKALESNPTFREYLFNQGGDWNETMKRIGWANSLSENTFKNTITDNPINQIQNNVVNQPTASSESSDFTQATKNYLQMISAILGGIQRSEPQPIVSSNNTGQNVEANTGGIPPATSAVPATPSTTAPQATTTSFDYSPWGFEAATDKQPLSVNDWYKQYADSSNLSASPDFIGIDLEALKRNIVTGYVQQGYTQKQAEKLANVNIHSLRSIDDTTATPGTFYVELPRFGKKDDKGNRSTRFVPITDIINGDFSGYAEKQPTGDISSETAQIKPSERTFVDSSGDTLQYTRRHASAGKAFAAKHKDLEQVTKVFNSELDNLPKWYDSKRLKQVTKKFKTDNQNAPSGKIQILRPKDIADIPETTLEKIMETANFGNENEKELGKKLGQGFSDSKIKETLRRNGKLMLPTRRYIVKVENTYYVGNLKGSNWQKVE